MTSPTVNLCSVCEGLDYSLSAAIKKQVLLNYFPLDANAASREAINDRIEQLKIDYPKRSMRTLKASFYVSVICVYSFYATGLLCLTKLGGQELSKLQKNPAFLEALTRSSWTIPLSCFSSSLAGMVIATVVNDRAVIHHLCEQLEAKLSEQS